MRVLCGVLALVLSFGVSLRAAAEEACPVHEVVAGDTLGDVALKYYGERDEAARIYAANRDVIGANIDLIERGQRLELPCAGGLALIAMPDGAPAGIGVADAILPFEPVDGAGISGEKAVAESAMAAKTMAEKTMAPKAMTDSAMVAELAKPMMAMMPSASLHVLTGGPFVPFAAEDLPGGGMIVELLDTALAASGEPDFSLAFVNDRDAHLGTVMPRGGFGLAAPWVYPDCANDLEPSQRDICDRFIASDGFYEFVTEFYARADSEFASVVLPGGLVNTRFCRPVGYPVVDLAAYGLLPDRLTMIRTADPAACLRALDAGDVDIASMDAAVTRALIDQIDVENPIVVLESLTEVNRLRVLAPRADPDAESRIARLNAALEVMSGDGRWFEIVSRHLRGTSE